MKLIGTEDLVSSDDRVLIKPNCVSAVPSSTGIITDPRVVEAILLFVRNCGAKDIVIAEGGGVGHTDRAFKTSGISDVASRHNVRLININKDEGIPMEIPGSQVLREALVSRTVLESTCIINVPALKIHHMAVVTLSMKNLMGAALPPRDLTMHTNLDEKLVDLSTLIKPRINVISGIVGAEMDETKGSPVKMGLVIAGRDIVAVDAVGSAVMGVDPKSVRYIQLAEERGLGIGALERIDVLGNSIGAVKRIFDRRISQERRENYAKTYGSICLSCSREELRRYSERTTPTL